MEIVYCKQILLWLCLDTLKSSYQSFYLLLPSLMQLLEDRVFRKEETWQYTTKIKIAEFNHRNPKIFPSNIQLVPTYFSWTSVLWRYKIQSSGTKVAASKHPGFVSWLKNISSHKKLGHEFHPLLVLPQSEPGRS